MKCDSSRNYLIRMQITTLTKSCVPKYLMWFITKLLDTNANHNLCWPLLCGWFNVIHHEITWYECKSQLSRSRWHRRHECDSSRNYLIRMQITTSIGGRVILQKCDSSRNYLIRMQITTHFSSAWRASECDSSRNYLIRMQITTSG